MKTRKPNGTGTFCKMKDGRYKWKQMIDGEERQLTARSPKELQEKVKKVADLPIVQEVAGSNPVTPTIETSGLQFPVTRLFFRFCT